MKLKSRASNTIGFEMSSMTDLIFLLLVFFVLISTLIVPNVNALKLTLPNSETSEKTKNIKVSVAVTEDGSYYLNNQPIPVENLYAVLQNFLADKSNPVVILHAQNTVPIENIVKVMDVANKLKVKLVLATHPEK